MTIAATSNVVRLPTAASRKVKQPRFQSRAYYRAKSELPQHPADCLTPYQRRILEDAGAITHADEEALRLIVLALFKAMSPAGRAKVELSLLPHAEKPHGRGALAVLRYQHADYGDVMALKWAMAHLELKGGVS